MLELYYKKNLCISKKFQFFWGGILGLVITDISGGTPYETLYIYPFFFGFWLFLSFFLVLFFGLNGFLLIYQASCSNIMVESTFFAIIFSYAPELLDTD